MRGDANLPMPTGHAMLALPIREAPGGHARASRAQKGPGTGWDLSEIFKMKFKHIVGLLSAAAMSVALAGAAAAQDKTVKIGAIFPLSGNAASAGVHARRRSKPRSRSSTAAIPRSAICR